MTKTIAKDEELQTITLEEAQELISNKQINLMMDAENFTTNIIDIQNKEQQNLVTQDENKQADKLLDDIEE